MAKIKYSRRTKKAYKSKKTYKPKKSKTTKNYVKKVVKDTLARKIETKVFQAGAIIFPSQINNGQGSLLDNCIALTPSSPSMSNCQYYSIGNGTGQDQRIGDEIYNKGIYFSYQIIPNAYNATNNVSPCPMYVMLYFIKPKIGEQGGPTVSNYISGSSSAIFFENLANATSGLTGTFYDLSRRIDKDNYEIIAIKQHKVGFAGISGTGASTAYYGFNNNDFKLLSTGRIKLPTPKQLKVDRLGNIKYQPIYCLIQYIRVDNIVANITQKPFQFTYNIAQYFTDM